MIKILKWLFLCLMLCNFCFAQQDMGTSEGRLALWKNLIHSRHSEDVVPLLRQVNDFFNQMHYVPNTNLTGETDIWLTPYEFLMVGGGNCKDFSIAKYFTLVAMGVPEKNLKIIYVTLRKGNLPHMVVAYYPTPDADPLILDNVIQKIEPASTRTDLIPVYSFNGENVWLNDTQGESKVYGKPNILSKWQSVMRRLAIQGGVK